MSPTKTPPLGDGPPGESSLDKSNKTIQAMFAGVAPRYDLLNRVLSGSLDMWWRRKATRAALAARDAVVSTNGAKGPGEILDLCCGTGDQAASLAGRGARVVGADFCLPMLALAQPKLARAEAARNGAPPQSAAPLATADAQKLPFPAGRFSAVTVSFGLRNVANLDLALEEIHRVLQPGGRGIFLEFALPRGPIFGRLYGFYFKNVLPRIGAVLSPRGSAYNYLPSSVEDFPQREGFTSRMAKAGFVDSTYEELSGGTVCLYSGLKNGGLKNGGLKSGTLKEKNHPKETS